MLCLTLLEGARRGNSSVRAVSVNVPEMEGYRVPFRGSLVTSRMPSVWKSLREKGMSRVEAQAMGAEQTTKELLHQTSFYYLSFKLLAHGLQLCRREESLPVCTDAQPWP